MHYTRLVAIATLAASLALVGCESSDDIDGNIWTGESSSSEVSQPTTSETSETPQVTTPVVKPSIGIGNTANDQISYGSLNWTYGGQRPTSAQITTVTIDGISLTSGDVYYGRVNHKWTGASLTTWGVSGNREAYGALFVRKSDGSWVGGKFEWTEPSRSSIPLKSIAQGYAGWTLDGVPNPCQVALVIVSKDNKWRTNVAKGTWTR